MWLCLIKIIPTGIFYTSIKFTNYFNCCLLISAWFSQSFVKPFRSTAKRMTWSKFFDKVHFAASLWWRHAGWWGRCTNVTSQLLWHAYVAGQTYPPLVGHKNMYNHREQWHAWRRYVRVKFQMKQREQNDWWLVEISKGRMTSGMRNQTKSH